MVTTRRRDEPERSEILALFRSIASGNAAASFRLLKTSPGLAVEAIPAGARRGGSTSYFLDAIAHYVYAGDTALHITAAAYQADMARELVDLGANPRARNRLGSEPLHYAAVGGPGSKHWNPEAQVATIAFLIGAGADPNAANKSGAGPLHQAVRTRCAAAVRALLSQGADPRRPNGSGSTPLHLAVQNTGRGGSGSVEARDQQTEIIRLLIAAGARPADRDRRGRTVLESIRGGELGEILHRQLSSNT
jgi:ankyrin repeat protein